MSSTKRSKRLCHICVVPSLPPSGFRKGDNATKIINLRITAKQFAWKLKILFHLLMSHIHRELEELKKLSLPTVAKKLKPNDLLADYYMIIVDIRGHTYSVRL